MSEATGLARETDAEVLAAYDRDEIVDAKTLTRAIRLRRKQEDAADGDFRYPLARATGEGSDICKYEIDDIQVGSFRRPTNEDRVLELMASIQAVGLLHPPIVFVGAVCYRGQMVDMPVLIAGRHRIEAWKRLGHHEIPCLRIKNLSDTDAELMEIAENLHRAELTALQRSEQIARWIALAPFAGTSNAISRQPDAKPGRPEGGVRAAARELGLSEPDARRAVTVAGLSPEAKAAAVDAGLDNNRTALLAAAKEVEPARQVEALVARVRPAAPAQPTSLAQVHRAERNAAFMEAVQAVEPLLLELEDDGDEGHAFAYDGLAYLQLAERYRPVMAVDIVCADGKDGERARGRVLRARETLFQIMCIAARAA